MQINIRPSDLVQTNSPFSSNNTILLPHKIIPTSNYYKIFIPTPQYFSSQFISVSLPNTPPTTNPTMRFLHDMDHFNPLIQCCLFRLTFLTLPSFFQKTFLTLVKLRSISLFVQNIDHNRTTSISIQMYDFFVFAYFLDYPLIPLSLYISNEGFIAISTFISFPRNEEIA